MELTEFVNKIFNRFPPDLKGNDTIESITEDYISALDTGKDYNYDNAFIELMRSYSFKTLPTAKIILETLNRNEILNKGRKENTKFQSLYAFSPKHNHWYEFGIEPDIGESATVRSLVKQGFTNITNQNPRFQNAAIC